MKKIVISLSSIAIVSTLTLLFYKINKLQKENESISSRIKKIESVNDSLYSINNKKSSIEKDKPLMHSVAWMQNEGKLSVFINGRFFNVVRKPIFGIPDKNGITEKNKKGIYELTTGLSLAPNDSSRMISTSNGNALLVHPPDPRYFRGLEKGLDKY